MNMTPHELRGCFFDMEFDLDEAEIYFASIFEELHEFDDEVTMLCN